MIRPVVLVVLDGTGVSDEAKGNAVALAKKPNFERFSENYLGTKLQASGIAVGVPWGEVGSSEVGHTNIGAGTVLYQNYPRISLAIQDGTFFKMPVWDEAVKRPNIHIMGLATNSGIHAHIDHLIALIKVLGQKRYKGGVYIHLFTDGEDAPPRSAPTFVKMVEAAMKTHKIGKIASVGGRYWAMDRSKNWDRVQKFLDVLTEGKGPAAASAKEALDGAYGKKIEDDMIEPTALAGKDGQPLGVMKPADAAIFFNFRPDRARQLTEKLCKIKGLEVITMTQYEEGQCGLVAFPPQYITEPLAKVVSDAGKKQFHIAESEKYAHATYFINGGREAPFPGEDRMTVPSLKIKSYAEKPEMGAYEITDNILKALAKDKYDLFVANFANGDMVGHTGELKAGARAIEVVDECLGKIADKALELGGTLVITADHGNCEEMINFETGKPDTEHSTNPVPLFIIGKDYEAKDRPMMAGEPTGILADVAPTILEIMGIKKPKEMTGQSLLHSIGRLPIQ